MTNPDYDNLDYLKLPPHSVEAEQAVIGGLINAGYLWTDVSGLVGSSDFYRHSHQIIFNEISLIAESGTEADVITLFFSQR